MSPRTSSARHRSLLRPLGVVGYDALEPALLAALATEEPLLLVSDHGAAKTLLLTRLADALGLALRHYNASLLQFDDLVGFPIPDDRGGIRYASPPGAIWEAEAVFLDEIGRCRPEVANKLFPIVHERRIQGIALERLRHRWAATNPPAEAQDAAADAYEGVERLDPALADRFTYVVQLPRWRDLGDADRAAVVRGVPADVTAAARADVAELVAATQAVLPLLAQELDDATVQYVLAIAPRLEAVGIVLGGRRAAMLRRAIIGVAAASVALGRPTGEAAFRTALTVAIPDVVRRLVRPAVLTAAHREAWQGITLDPSDPNRLLADVRDPARRAALALQLPRLRPAVRAQAIATAVAALASPQREILAWHLFPHVLSRDDIPATAQETVADLVRTVADGGQSVMGYGAVTQWTVTLRKLVAAFAPSREAAEFLFNALAVAYRATHPFQRPQQDPIEAWFHEHADFWRRCARAFRTRCEEAAA